MDVVVYDSAARPICEVQLLFSTTTNMPETCHTTSFPAIINIFQPLGDNKWLYILSNETSAVLQCDNEVSNHQLKESGIITLPPRCKLHTGYSTITAFYTTEKNMTFPMTVPDIRTDDCFEDIKTMKNPKLVPISINEIPLDSLKQIKNHLDKYNDELEKIKTASFIQRHGHSFSWIYFSLGFIMLTYILIKICNRCPNGFISRRRRSTSGCIQIFNNCFDRSNRRRSTTLAIPMTTLPARVVEQPAVSEDEDDNPSPTLSQRSGTHPQSLF
ncbi:hypothetical protein O0L34_g19396 [Tuta absoluta]|nr:hypothetical protein O0L34_g19127 [Tuta absoluta]KAJ2938073.1 hypothetical protein O0L34_g19396 [Tuta absoluta]